MATTYNHREQTLIDIRNYLRHISEGTQCVGFQQLSITGTAVNLTVPVNATSCRFTVDNSAAQATAARYRMDGTAPTSSIGEILGHLDTLDIINTDNMKSV